MTIEAFDVRVTKPSHVVIEMFGGDNNLSAFVGEDLEEARRGINGNFALLALADRLDGEAEIVEVSAGRRTTIASLGEVDTGDPSVLAKFLTRALVTYRDVPHVAIGFWDHGTGVFDEKDDAELILRRRPLSARSARRLLRPSDAANGRAMLHDDHGGLLTTREAGKMIDYAFQVAGRENPVDIVFSDTCLNGMVEVSHELGGRAHVVVASEDLEPGDGWDYYHLFRLMSLRPPTTADAWAVQMIEAFELGYVDRPDQHPCTLAGFRTKSEMVDAFAAVVAALRECGRPGFREALEARMDAQSFAGSDRYATIDLRHFAALLSTLTSHAPVKVACEALVASVDAARVAEVHLGATVQDASGIAFWFPSSRLEFAKDRRTYEALACGARTRWTDYLDSMLTRRP